MSSCRHDNAVQKLSRIFFMTFRSISARLLPNARTAFTSDLFKKIPRRRDFRRYLFLSPSPPFFSLALHCIDFFFFFFSFINTFRAVRAWLGNPDRCFSLEYKRDRNHDGLYGDGIKAYFTRESSRKRKSWLAYSRWTKANRRPRHRVKVNNSRFSLCDSQATGVAFRRSATLNQRQFIDNGKKTAPFRRRHQTEINAIRISWQLTRRWLL